jgi:hypothetical protein
MGRSHAGAMRLIGFFSFFCFETRCVCFVFGLWPCKEKNEKKKPKKKNEKKKKRKEKNENQEEKKRAKHKKKKKKGAKHRRKKERSTEEKNKKRKRDDEDERAVEAELDHVVDFVWRFDRDVLYARDDTQAFVRPGVRARTGNFDLVLDRDPRCAVGQTTHRTVRIIKKNKKK